MRLTSFAGTGGRLLARVIAVGLVPGAGCGRLGIAPELHTTDVSGEADPVPMLTAPLGGSRTGGVPEEGALKMGMVCRAGGWGSEGVRGREREP